MKTSVKFLIVVLCLGGLSGKSVAQELPERDKVLEKMVLANDYFMNEFPDVGKKLVTDAVRPSNIWTRGVYYEGLMALHEIYPKEEFYDYAFSWAEFHDWGMRNGNTTRNADDQCCGQTYIELYKMSPDPEKIRNIKTSIDMMVNTPQNDDWWWIDALQMAMPVFAELGVMYDDHSYFEKMYDIYMYTKNEHGDNGLFNPEDGLWWRDSDFDPPYTEPNGEDCYWSRGNGWVYAALVRVLDVIPEDAVGYDEYMNMYLEMTNAIRKVQREDGFWNVSLHDPDNYGGEETTGTALFTYGMAWGINNNVLSSSEYTPIVAKAWNAMAEESLHDNGFLGYVQGTGKEPKDGQPVTYDSVPDFQDYGLGCFLLAGSEIYKME